MEMYREQSSSGKVARRCGVVNASTAAGQLLLFTFCAGLVGGPALVAARWGLGALTAVSRFFLTRGWVFDARHERKRDQAWRFAVMSAASVSLGTVVFAALLALAPPAVHPLLVQLASMSVVWFFFGYPATRRWVFPEARGEVQVASS